MRSPAQLAGDEIRRVRMRDYRQAVLARKHSERQNVRDDVRKARAAFNAERIARGKPPIDFDARSKDGSLL